MKKRIHYPAQTGPYKVMVVRKTASWQDFDTARIHISLGNPNQVGAKLKATLDWATPRFEKVIIILSDTLHWHNLAFLDKLSKEDAIIQAKILGQNWLIENDFLSSYPIQLCHWDEWRLLDELHRVHEIINDIYKTDPLFQKLLLEKSERIWGVSYSSNPKAKGRYSEFLVASRNYILSELGVFCLMFNQADAIEVYPGSWFIDLFETLGSYAAKIPVFQYFINKPFVKIDFRRNLL